MTENSPLPTVSAEEVAQFFDLYKTAWEKKRTDLATSLFTEDVDYRENRFGEPLQGHTTVRSYWQDRVFEHQQDIRFDYKIWSTRGNEAMVTWQARFHWVPINGIMDLDGVTLVRFVGRQDGHLIANMFHEWFDISERP